jgi:hypothetical protein
MADSYIIALFFSLSLSDFYDSSYVMSRVTK